MSKSIITENELLTAAKDAGLKGSGELNLSPAEMRFARWVEEEAWARIINLLENEYSFGKWKR